MAQENERTYPSKAFKTALKKTAHEQSSSLSTPGNCYVTKMPVLSPLDVNSQSRKTSDNLRTKRCRPSEMCDDIDELRRRLVEKDEILASLQQELKSAKKKVNSSPGEARSSLASSTSKELQKEVAKVRKSIQSQVHNQMAYKPSARFVSAKLVPGEFTEISEPMIKFLVGETLYLKASSGPKQLKIIASNEELEGIFPYHSFSKRLRYGATLELTKGLTILHTKATSTLRVTGN